MRALNRSTLFAAAAAAAAIGGASALLAGPWDYDKVVIRKTSEFIADLNVNLGNGVSYGLRTSNMSYAPADPVYSGTVSGSRPTVNARWRGNMRAMVVGHKRRGLGNILRGLVNIGFRAADSELNLAIHQIRNLDKGGAYHVIKFVPFSNVAVTGLGEFSASIRGSGGETRSLSGRFHGSGHENFTFEFRAHGMRGVGGGTRFVNASDPPARMPVTGSIRRGGARYTVESGDATFSLEAPETGLSGVMTSHTGIATGTAPTANAHWEGRIRAIVVGEGERDAPFRGDVLDGWVNTAFRASNNRINVVIHEIRNIDRGRAYHVVRSVIFKFREVAVADTGEFSVSGRGSEGEPRTLDGRFYGTDHRDFAFTFEARGMRGGGGGTRATEAPPEWAEARRVNRAVAGLLANSDFDNARDSSDTWIAPDSAQTAADGAVVFSDWSCGFQGGANKFSCDISGSQVSLVADLSGARAGVSDEPLREIGGIQLSDVGGRQTAYRDVRRYGGWMEHAGFYLYTGVPAESTDENTQLQAGQAFTIVDNFGTASGSAPSADAKYTGAMVSTPAPGLENHGDVLVGSAELGYDPNMDNMFTLRFANLYNVDKQQKLLDPSIVVAPTYIRLASANEGRPREVRVAFYGPNHEEVAGTFNLLEMIGAFGAKRPLSPAEQELARAATAINTLLGDGNDSTLDNTRETLASVHPGNAVILGAPYTFVNQGCGFGANAKILACNVRADDNSGGTEALTLDADLAGGTPGDLRAVGGLQLTDVEAAGDSDTRRFGAWMDHAGFYLYTDVPASIAIYDNAVDFAVADSFGNASNSRPGADATYAGAMVGTPDSEQSNYGDALVGEAALGYTAATGAVTLDFTNLTNVDGGTVPGNITSISFADVNPVAAADGGGAITSDNSSAALSARFYGPNNEEVAGRFAHSNIFGSFGVKRQAQ